MNMIILTFMVKLSKEKGQAYFAQNDFGLYRNTLLSIAELLKHEERMMESLEYYFRVAYMDISGLGNGFSLEARILARKMAMNNFYFPYKSSIAKIAPGIRNEIEEIYDELELVKEEQHHHYEQAVLTLKLPFHLFTIDEAYEILWAEIMQDEVKLEKIYELAAERNKGR